MRLVIAIVALLIPAGARAQGAGPPPETGAATLPGDGTAGLPPAEIERARMLFERGVEAAQEQMWAEALDAFRASRAIVPRASTLFNIATTLQRLGRARDAIAAIDQYLAVADPIVDAAQRGQAALLRESLEEGLVRLRVTVRPAIAELAVDGRADASIGEQRELVLDPGDHVIVATASGFVPVRVDLTIAPGATEEREVVLTRVEDQPAHLLVRASAGAARMTIDDLEVGATGEEIDLPPGRHVVVVRATEHHDYTRIVELMPGEHLDIEAPLRRVRETSIVEEPAFWAVLGGVALAGAGVAVGVYYGTGGQQASPYGGTLGFTLEGLVSF